MGYGYVLARYSRSMIEQKAAPKGCIKLQSYSFFHINMVISMVWENRISLKRELLGICVLGTLCLILFSPMHSVAQVEHNDLTGVKVGVFDGTGEMNSSRIALVRMFEWMGASVEEVTASQILGDYLEDCDILVFPGGAESSYMIDLQYATGIEKIQEFIENGGSYFGICGGSTFGARTLNLFDGKMCLVTQPGESIHMTTMFTCQNSTGPDISNFASEFSTMYYVSQCFVPNPGVSVHRIATYEPDGRAGMIAFEYGNGTVFLSSPHPEYEEDSDRDGTTFGDYLDDPDSEWELLLDISLWLVDASNDVSPGTVTVSENNTTTSNSAYEIQVLPIASTGVVTLVLVAAVVFRRIHK